MLSLQVSLEQAMDRCIELAEQGMQSDNYPIAAAVVDASGIVSIVGSHLVEGVDPSAHPEVMAMREAARQRGSRYLPGCYLVSTLEPCPMCSAMAVWAKLAGVAYGASQLDALALRNRIQHPRFTFRQIQLRCSDVLDRGEPKLALHEGVRQDRAKELLDKFALQHARHA